MKTCLICPSERPAVAALAHTAPLSTLPFLGKSLLEYWLEHMAGLGAKQVLVLAADRPGMVHKVAGNGGQWGMSVEVVTEARELSPPLARAKYPVAKATWLPEPNDVVLMTHFPGLPQYPLFTSYACCFSAVLGWLPHAAGTNRIGVYERHPGVWVAMRARVSETARLLGPCWIGEGARVGPRSVIGPNAVLENHVFVESDCEISNTWVGPATLVGKLTELKDSIVFGGDVVDLKTGSLVRVPDPFLVCGLGNPLLPPGATDWLRQLGSIVTRYNEELHLLWKHRKIKLP